VFKGAFARALPGIVETERPTYASRAMKEHAV
jgi:hypothetical protein